MKKVTMFLLQSVLYLGLNALNVSSNNTIPGAYTQQNNANQVMSVDKTQMQVGATDQAHANYINTKSGQVAHPIILVAGAELTSNEDHRKLKMSGKYGE